MTIDTIYYPLLLFLFLLLFLEKSVQTRLVYTAIVEVIGVFTTVQHFVSFFYNRVLTWFCDEGVDAKTIPVF